MVQKISVEDQSEVQTWEMSEPAAMRDLWPGAWFEAAGDVAFRAVVRRRQFAGMVLEGIEASPYQCQRTYLDVAARPTDTVSINVVLQGSVLMREAGTEYLAERGDVFVHRNQAFSFRCEEFSRTFRAVVHPRAIPPLAGHERALGLCSPSTLTRAYSRFCEEILTSTSNSSDALEADSLEQSAFALQRGLISSLLQQHDRTPLPLTQLRAQVLEHIEYHFRDPAFGTEQLLRDFQISRRWLFRVFEGEPESLAELLRRRRVESATRDLERHPELSVQDIGRRNGFSGRDTFSRAFKGEHGHSPSKHKY